MRSNLGLSYWKLTTEAEVDFVIGDMRIAIEAKTKSVGEPSEFDDCADVR